MALVMGRMDGGKVPLPPLDILCWRQQRKEEEKEKERAIINSGGGRGEIWPRSRKAPHQQILDNVLKVNGVQKGPPPFYTGLLLTKKLDGSG